MDSLRMPDERLFTIKDRVETDEGPKDHERAFEVRVMVRELKRAGPRVRVRGVWRRIKPIEKLVVETISKSDLGPFYPKK